MGKAVQASVEEEYKKTGIRREDIQELRRWLETQPHLPASHITELDLILTYHSCDCSSAVSKEVIDLHYTLRTLFTTLFSGRGTDPKVSNTLEVILCCLLETRSHEGYAVHYNRLLDTDPKHYIYGDVVRLVLMTLDLVQYEEGSWPGLIIIVDMHGITLGHLPKLDLQVLQQTLYFLQGAMLVKLKGLHFINAPSFMDKILMMMKPFLKKELMDVLCIHQVGSNTIDKYIPKGALPSENGGAHLNLHEAKLKVIEKIEANREYFIEEEKKRVVESLRRGKPKTIANIFGSVEGTFKKLDID